MNAQQLRNSILQLAIQGKLVPQDSADEPASVLLQKIHAEKERLVKEGKLKKKDLITSPVEDEDIPFDLPKGWEWCRLGDISVVARGGSPRPIKEYLTDGEGYNWIKIGDTDKGGKYINHTQERIIKEGLKKSRLIHKGDFLLTNSMSFGRPYISNIEGCIHDGWLVISQSYGDIYNQDFLYYLLSSRYSYNQFCDKVSGAVVQNLNSDKVAESIFPIPPLAEQKRIVAKLEELLPIVEEYGKAQSALDCLNTELPARLRQSVLQQAIQGKLVPQDSADEPASVLLQKIHAEKEQLVKEGKLKKKDLITSPVEDEDIPFELPKGWEFLKLKDICALIDGEKRAGKLVCLDAKFLRGKEKGTILTEGKYVPIDTNIILVDGENSGEVFTTPQEGYMGSTFKQLWISEKMYIPYVLNFILFFKETLRNDKRGAAIPHLNKDLFYNFVVGIPPLAEQKRIVAKIEELFAAIDKLK